MNAVALVKQVPDRNSVFRLAGEWIDESSLGYGMGDYDRCAVEAVLALKDAGEAVETVAVTAGPAEASQVLRTSLAMGVDRGVHLVCPRAALADPFRVAKALAEAVRPLDPGIVTAGLVAEDSGHGQVAGLLAGLLGWSWASAATAIRLRSGVVEVERELENRRSALVELRLPAVVAVQTGMNTPRYASLRGIMASRRKPVERLEPPGLQHPTAADGGLRSLALRRPERAATAEIVEGPLPEAAAKLAERIRAGAGISFPGESR